MGIHRPTEVWRPRSPTLCHLRARKKKASVIQSGSSRAGSRDVVPKGQRWLVSQFREKPEASSLYSVQDLLDLIV